MNLDIYIIILILVLVIFYIYYIYVTICDNFANIVDTDLFDYYVISIGNPGRLSNISNQANKNNIDIKIFNGFLGDKLDLQDLINKNKLKKEFVTGSKQRNREIGCYLSHTTLYNDIKLNPNKKKYSVIFEDDFDIDSREYIFTNYINNIIKDVEAYDFDIIYLGNLYLNHGNLLANNVYYPDKTKDLLCMHAYIINNKNIKKFTTEEMMMIDDPIDNKINKLIKNRRLNALVIYPAIVHQQGASLIN
jgi:GR25 family glycosyltransferase involved in LPS biosynthesis